jgi:serine protease Do
MKRVISTVIIASLGGLIALTANDILKSKTKKFSSEKITSTPVSLTNFNGSSTGSNTDFTMAAEKSLNAVVHIKTTAERSNNLSYDPFAEWFFGHRNNSQPYVQQGSGSGVIISGDGYIVTNNHVIQGADKIEVVLNDKRSFIAEVAGADPNTDVALLKIQEKELPFLSYGNSDLVKIGEWVLAVGNPFNLNSTVTAGIISAKGRNNILAGKSNPVESFLQTDAAVNPGNSGGALVNTNGELIGINTAIASNNGAYQGYSFAIPVNIVKKIVSDLSEFGAVQRAYLGVSIQDIDAKFAEEMNLKQLKGVYVNGITSGGSASDAGIGEGDVITKIQDAPVASVSELQEQISKYRPGDKINVTLMRNNKEVNATTILKGLSNTTAIVRKAEVKRSSIGSLGAAFEEVSADDLAKLKLQNGVKVAKLSDGKLYRAGIKEGFIITSIDKKKISSFNDVEKILSAKASGEGVLIEGVYPNGMRAYVGFGM